MSSRLRAAGTWLLIFTAGVLAGFASLVAGTIVMLLSGMTAVTLARTHGLLGVGAFLTGCGITWLLVLGPRVEVVPGGLTALLAVLGGVLTAAGAMLTILGRRSHHPVPRRP